MTEPKPAGPDDGAPADPITTIAEGAASAHEMFLTYTKAGFSEQQAIYLVAQILTAHLRPSG